MMTIKRIFTDMDGTLLNAQGRVSKANATNIKDADIPVTLVSARAPMEMLEAIELLDLTGPQVAFNGGLIFQKKNGCILPLHTEIIKRKTAQNLLAKVRQHFPQVSLSYYDLNHWYCDKIDEGIRFEYDLTRQAPSLINEPRVFLQAQENTFKIMMICFEEETMRELEKYLQALEQTDVAIQRSGKFYLEITSKNAKKSKGISYILKKEKLKQEETAAFGDGHNDLPMLEMVGYPIVMANAFEDIKRVAYKVTKSNEQDGVGYGIHKFLKGLNHDKHSTNRQVKRLFGF